MLAVDTNVLVRLLVTDDAAQQKAATSRLAKARSEGEPVLVTPIVLAELAWVLESVYGRDRAAVADAVRRILDTPPFLVLERAPLQEALAWYAAGSAGFSDYLVLALSLRAGASTLVTFDKRLLESDSVERP